MMNEVTTYQGIPAMTSPKVHKYLKEIGSQWTGRGIAMELGCWLGASSVPLLEGLVEAGYDRMFWGLDKFQANSEQAVKAMNAAGWVIKPNQSLEQLYLAHCREVYENVNAVKGNMPKSLDYWEPKEPIEICIFDAPKQEPVFTGCIKKLIKYWIPGVTILGLLDYRFWERHTGRKRQMFRAPVDFMEKWSRHFERIKSWEDESPVFFKYVKPIEYL